MKHAIWSAEAAGGGADEAIAEFEAELARVANHRVDPFTVSFGTTPAQSRAAIRKLYDQIKAQE